MGRPGLMLSKPEPIEPHHDCSAFASGSEMLDRWLQLRALANDRHGAARTRVVHDGGVVRGYFALAASSVAQAETTGRFRRNMPDPVPVILLARLALDGGVQGSGVGRVLFRDAMRQVLVASDIVGVRGMIVHAISPEARAVYTHMGMRPSPLSDMTLMLPCAEIRAALG